MGQRTKIGLSCALALLVTTTTHANAEPRSIKIRADGSTVEIDYRTNRVKERPRKDGSGTDTSDGGGETQLSALPPLDLSDMRLWNWQGRWHASEWDHAFSDVPWRFAKINQASNGDTFFNLDRNGAPELQAINQPAQTRGLWEAEVTLPNEASGLAIAPLWLYNSSSKDEIDFEFVGTKGLQVNIHSYSTGKHVQAPVMLAGTSGWSGRRVRFGIRSDLDAGKIELMINGKIVHTYLRSTNPGAFPSTALKPFISMWPAKSGLSWAETWLGKWAGEPATMVVHGYRFTS
jgi:hypothetical protein